MTILFFTRLFYPHIGGVERHVLEISKRMVKHGHTVHVITENNAWSTVETVEGITVHRMNVGPDTWWKKFRIWMWLEKNRQLISDADIIHCHDVFFWYFPFRFFFIHKSVYTTFHGYETKFPPSKKAVFIRKISEIISFGNICVGEYIKKWYGTKATFITYGGITKSSKPLKAIKNTSDKITIVFIGRLEADTGITHYLHTLDILKKRKIKYTFHLYGDGSLKKIAEEYGTVHGFIENVSNVLDTATVTFASSYLSILDAFAKSKLVFSMYDNSLKKDYLLMTPFSDWIIAEKNAETLADKIIYYLTHTSAASKRVSEEKRWVDTQTWEKVVLLYYKLWKI